MNTYRQAVVVLGMHRSGTSAVAGTMVRLGLRGPKTPLPASDDNPSGFYESLPVFNMNYRLLLQQNCSWNLCFMLEPGQLLEKMTLKDRQKAFSVLLHEYGDTDSFVLKEPRLCVTLPVWLPALEALSGAIRVLLVLRHPVEIIRSLKSRNNLPESETAPLWLFHMLEAERISRQFKRAAFSYDELMRDWRGCMMKAGQRAGIHWPDTSKEAGIEIDTFLAAPSRQFGKTYSARLGPEPVDRMVEASWAALLRLAENPSDAAAMAVLDTVNDDFTIWRRRMFPPGTRLIFGETPVRED